MRRRRATPGWRRRRSEVLAAATVAANSRGAHGRVPDSELVDPRAAAGSGGGALTHASDLDLVYLLHRRLFAAESDGAKPLGAALYYNRLAQRLTAALSVPTAAGPLYRGRYAAAAIGRARVRWSSRWRGLRALPARGRLDVGAYGAGPRAAGRSDRRRRSPSCRHRRSSPRVLGGRAARARSCPRRPCDDARRHGAAQAARRAARRQARARAGSSISSSPSIWRSCCTGRGLRSRIWTRRHPCPDRGGGRYCTAGAADRRTISSPGCSSTLRLVAPDAQEPPPATQVLIARALRLPDWPAVLAAFAATRQEVEAVWRGMTGGCDG